MGGVVLKNLSYLFSPPFSHNPQPKKGENYVALIFTWLHEAYVAVSFFFFFFELLWFTVHGRKPRQTRLNVSKRIVFQGLVLIALSPRLSLRGFYLSSQSISKVVALNVIPAIALIMIAWTLVWDVPKCFKSFKYYRNTSNEISSPVWTRCFPGFCINKSCLWLFELYLHFKV